jgi:hypothetical protein
MEGSVVYSLVGGMWLVILALLGSVWANLGRRLDKINGNVHELYRITGKHSDRISVTEQRDYASGIASELESQHHTKVEEKILAQLDEITLRINQLSGHCVSIHGVKIGEAKKGS